jgi:hypothetical protein
MDEVGWARSPDTLISSDLLRTHPPNTKLKLKRQQTASKQRLPKGSNNNKTKRGKIIQTSRGGWESGKMAEAEASRNSRMLMYSYLLIYILLSSGQIFFNKVKPPCLTLWPILFFGLLLD